MVSGGYRGNQTGCGPLQLFSDVITHCDWVRWALVGWQSQEGGSISPTILAHEILQSLPPGEVICWILQRLHVALGLSVNQLLNLHNAGSSKHFKAASGKDSCGVCPHDHS